MQLRQGDRAERGEQLDLGLELDSRKIGRSRIWLLAAEPPPGTRLSIEGDPLCLMRGGSYAFIDPEAGRTAFAATDLLLFRCGNGDGYRLLVPEAFDLTPVAAGALVAELEAQFQSGSISGVRGHAVTNVTCLLLDSRAPDPPQEPATARTRLERALLRMTSLPQPAAPLQALQACQVVERLFAGDSHRALHAVVSNARAVALNDIHHDIGLVGSSPLVPAFYEQAARAFTCLGLGAVARGVQQTADSCWNGLQMSLPGLDDSGLDKGAVVSDGPRVLPMLALALDVDGLRIGCRSSPTLFRYRDAGLLSVRDSDLCHIVAPLSSPSRRIVATVSAVEGRFQIRAGHADGLRAVLRLSSSEPTCAGVEVVTLDSDSLEFDNPDILVKSSDQIEVLADPVMPGDHDVAMRFHMRDGVTALLQFRIPAEVTGELTYA